ncbi:Organic cation transporter protein [Nymphon striatum]|nr:Organic cation transporter protein [Nymphon striatum]
MRKESNVFLTNYMRQVKVLLIFTAATRSADWKLHLSTTEELLHYFHAHDQYNYGRWGPLYVADMLELQLTDLDTWSFLDKGNFVISKRSVPFTVIGPDHAIEQEHKKMKMKREFIGITGNEQAMEKHFVIAPTISRIVQEFKEYAGIDSRRACSLHHELTSEKSSKLVRNAAKLVGNINMQGNPFLKNDMYNLMTFAVAPDDVSKDIEYRDQHGKEALQHFVSTRMVDNTVEFWGAQKKNKFKLLVIAKSRPEFVVKDAIGNFEFNVAPPSNFHPDGFLIMLSSKSQLVPLIMKMSAPDGASNVVQYEENVSIRLLIIDAMCLVNMVVKTPEMTTAKQFFTKFLGIIQGMSASYYELRIVFDQYIPGTLKETTREKRSLKLAHIHYHVNDDTEIKSIKSFLAHIDTKAELTTYLSHNIISHYQGHRQKVLVMHHTTMLSNCPLSDIVSMPGMSSSRHSLEEGDQLVLLNACDVMHKDPQSFLDVFSVDIDVFVLLTGHYKLIPKSTTLIRRGSERLSIRESYLQLGQKRADALIGWYAFKGTYNTGSFAGKGVSCQFKAFLQADDDILDAFSRFGVVPEIPRIIHQQMERYTCLLYKLGDTCAKEVPELRWMLFAQKSKEGQQLPLTLGSLVPHTARAKIPESARWQLSVGRYDEAVKSLKKCAELNNYFLPDDSVLQEDIERMKRLQESKKSKENEKKPTIFDLFKTKEIRIRTLISYFLWFSVSFCYYAFSLNIGDMAGNIFVNMIIGSSLEIVGVFIGSYMLVKFGRKRCLASLMFFAGALLLLAIPIPTSISWLKVSISLLGRTCISMVFAMMYIHTAEYTPTVLRAIGIGSCNTCARLGSIIAPYAHQIKPVVFIIYGVLCILCGIAYLRLPETLNCPLPESIEDAKNLSSPQKRKNPCKFENAIQGIDGVYQKQEEE